MNTWTELFKQLIRAWLAQEIGKSQAEGLRVAERIVRGERLWFYQQGRRCLVYEYTAAKSVDDIIASCRATVLRVLDKGGKE